MSQWGLFFGFLLGNAMSFGFSAYLHARNRSQDLERVRALESEVVRLRARINSRAG